MPLHHGYAWLQPAGFIDMLATAPDLVVVAPHQRGATNEVVRHAKGVVHKGVRGHGTVVAAVLDGQADPGTSQACEQWRLQALLVTSGC